jgi:erythronate-4-phosphate dehydrogenase
MVDDGFFNGAKPGCIFINSARGAVVDTDALIGALDDGRVSHAVIDTWENEPDYRADLLERVDLGTPHIAGYSFDGKIRGTAMVYEEACRFLGRAAAWRTGEALDAADMTERTINAANKTDEEVLREIVRSVYDISADDRRLRETLPEDARTRAEGFDRLRKNYPVRREFPFAGVTVLNAAGALRDRVSGLGFALGCDGAVRVPVEAGRTPPQRA